MVVPYAYGTVIQSIRVRYIPYVYGKNTRMVQNIPIINESCCIHMTVLVIILYPVLNYYDMIFFSINTYPSPDMIITSVVQPINYAVQITVCILCKSTVQD